MALPGLGRMTAAEVLETKGPEVLVRYTIAGDATLDGRVNGLDFNAIATNFGAASISAASELGSIVPEPVVGLLVLAFVVAARHRKGARHP